MSNLDLMTDVNHIYSTYLFYPPLGFANTVSACSELLKPYALSTRQTEVRANCTLDSTTRSNSVRELVGDEAITRVAR
jgi:hypothetical protein